MTPKNYCKYGLFERESESSDFFWQSKVLLRSAPSLDFFPFFYFLFWTTVTKTPQKIRPYEENEPIVPGKEAGVQPNLPDELQEALPEIAELH
jgi:hypothetical protein